VAHLYFFATHRPTQKKSKRATKPTHQDTTIDDVMINNHIIKHFSFGEISTNNDRIMWSKDIFNSTGKIERNNPDISSLFFKQGILNKVTYTIHDPNTLVEFYS
jgi:hypothetical protein